MKHRYTTQMLRMPGDTFTPIGLYLQLRDKFKRCLLLESSDHEGPENCYSYICCEPLTEFEAQNDVVKLTFNGETDQAPLCNLMVQFEQYVQCHETRSDEKVPINGVFGFISYEAAGYFDPSLNLSSKKGKDIPVMQYAFYRYIIGMDHFRDEMFLIENIPQGGVSMRDQVLSLIRNRSGDSYFFETSGSKTSELEDHQFKKNVESAKVECKRGNVFQLVISREYVQPYIGDEFSVYRALRNINPSPYLFYYDGGNFRLFGSSPEAQLLLKNSKAEIHPIAGTFRRAGNLEKDFELAEQLKKDPKETAEHMMLVDLARNDLSTCCKNVNVSQLAQIQMFSHVIHLVSKVVGELKPEFNSFQLFSKTFPAGTLSGAPKHKAMQIIDKLEKSRRDYYGGALGYFGFNGDINHCIIIRTFLAQNNLLYYRAGAGVVIFSTDENELEEVRNKLSALDKAVENVVSKEIYQPGKVNL